MVAFAGEVETPRLVAVTEHVSVDHQEPSQKLLRKQSPLRKQSLALDVNKRNISSDLPRTLAVCFDLRVNVWLCYT